MRGQGNVDRSQKTHQARCVSQADVGKRTQTFQDQGLIADVEVVAGLPLPYTQLQIALDIVSGIDVYSSLDELLKQRPEDF